MSSGSNDSGGRYNLTVQSNHEDDVDQERRMEASRDNKDNKNYAPYPNTRITRAAPPAQLSTQMYRRSDSTGSGSSAGGPGGRRTPPPHAHHSGGPPTTRGRYTDGHSRGDNDYYGGGIQRTGSGDSRGGPPRGGDYPPPRGDRGGPSSAAERGPRPQPRGSQTSETLTMAEQDFLAKYGYAGGGPPNNNNNDSNNNNNRAPGAQSVPGGGQSVTSADTGYSGSMMSRPRMPRMGPGGGGGGDRYVSGGQSVTSHMTESVISNQRRHMDEEDMEMQRTQQSRGAGGGRSRSPPPPPGGRPRYDDRVPSRRNLYDRVQNYSNNQNGGGGRNTPERYGGGGDPRGGGNFPRPNSRRNLYGGDEDRSYADDPRGPPRGMDDPGQRRGFLQRMPSQSTISTSGFRSFYSDAYTIRDRDSVAGSGYYHNYHHDGPPPPPPRDDYGSPPGDRYGGAGVNRGRAPYGPPYGGDRSVASGSRGGGGYYGGPPPPRGGGSRGGPPPPRDYSPRRQTIPQGRGGPPPPSSGGGGGGQPDRPLLEVAPGLLMHLMGTDETMKAIQRGQITVTSCVVCGMDVHCHSASEYVLCPDCRVVSPVNQLDNAGDMTPQQGGLVGLGVKTEMLLTMMEAGAQQY